MGESAVRGYRTSGWKKGRTPKRKKEKRERPPCPGNSAESTTTNTGGKKREGKLDDPKGKKPGTPWEKERNRRRPTNKDKGEGGE